MRKRIAKIGIVILCLFTGYTVYWFHCAHGMKKNLLRSIASNSSYSKVTYQGFPFKVEVGVHHLKTEQLSMDGYLKMGMTVLGDRGWLETDGKAYVSSPSVLKDPIVLSGKIRLDLDNPFDVLRLLKKSVPNKQEKTFFKSLTRADFLVKNLTVAYGEEAPFIELENLQCSLGKLLAENPYDFGRSVRVNMEKFRLDSSQYAKLEELLFGRSYAIAGLDLLNTETFRLHANIWGARSINGSHDVRVELKELDRDTSTLSTKMKGVLRTCQKDRHQIFSVSGDMCTDYRTTSQSEFLAGYKTYFQKVIEEDRKGKKALDPRWKLLIKYHWDELSNCCPNLQPQGPITTQLDLGWELKLDEDEKIQDIRLDLNSLYVKASSMEVRVKGFIGSPNQPQIPYLELQISDYKDFVNQVAKNYNHLQKVLVSTNLYSSREVPHLTPKMVARVSQFLKSLSNDSAESADLTIRIQGRGSEDVKIGPFNVQECEKEYYRMLGDVIAELQSRQLPPRSLLD